MLSFQKLIPRLRSLFRRQKIDQAMNEEMRLHIELQARDNLADGMSSDTARTAAFRQFGRIEAIKETCRDQRGTGGIDNLLRDLRLALRMLHRNRGFSATAILTIALCLGANLAIFAVTDAILLRPLPFPAADRLVAMYNSYPKAGVDRDGSSLTCYYERRGAIPAFSSLSIYRPGTAVVGDTGATDLEEITRVSPEFFTTLGTAPILGRTFTEEEMTYQTDGVAILTDACWRQRFNASSQVVGQTIRVDGFPKTIVGVLPPGFRFLSSKSRLYLPLSSNPDQRTAEQRHSGSGSEIIARLWPDATLAQAKAQIDAQNAALASTYPRAKLIAEADFRTVMLTLRDDHTKSVRPVLLMIQSGALFLLLIGGANLVNLLLVRASSRASEFSIRHSLGAAKRHIAGQVLVETIVLSLAGGFLGLGLGAAGIRLLATLGLEQLPLGTQVGFDSRVVWAGLAGAILLGIAIAPPIIWFCLGRPMAGGLQSGSRTGTASPAAQRLRHGLIVVQMALAFVLLAGAGLLGLSLKRVMAVSPGFRPDHVLSGRVTLPWKNYRDGAARLAFTERLLEELGHLPGATAAGVINNIPLSGDLLMSALTVKGYVPPPGETLRGHYSYGVTGGYFAAMGIPLKEGRLLEAADCRREERVCNIDEDFARRYFPGKSPLGQCLFQGPEAGPDRESFTIVGVVGAVKPASLADNQALGAAYFPYVYRTDDNIYVVVRTRQSPEFLASALQKVVREIDPELPVNNPQSMNTRITNSLVARRSPALLAGIFAAVALLLAAIGTYGVLSYAVAQRRREIGVRMALGALPRQIAGHFLSLNLRLLALGIVLGTAGTWAAGRAMRSFLFDTAPLPLGAVLGTGAILVAVSLAACLLPVRRAVLIAPMEALRNE